MIKKITSLSNSLIQQVVKLHGSKYRSQRSQFIAEGIRTIKTFVESGYQPLTLFVTEEHSVFIKDLVPLNSAVIVSEAVMKKMSAAKTPSGLLAVFCIPPSPPLHTLSSGIVLAGMLDPGNVGTLIRTAVAMNKKSAILINSVDPFSPKVVQASTGALALIDVYTMSWDELMEYKDRPKLCALTVSNGQDPKSLDLSDSLIVVGGEARGLPIDWVKQCDARVTLPMPGGFESLNAAVAGSIALYLSLH